MGGLARSIEQLRENLSNAEQERKVAMFQSAGFGASSAAMLMCDLDMKISITNEAFSNLVQTHAEHIRSRAPHFDPDNILGQNADIFHDKPINNRESLENATFPHTTDIECGPITLNLTIGPIIDQTGVRQGYVLEWKDVTELRKNSAILEALDEGSLKAEFDRNGQLVSSNQHFLKTVQQEKNSGLDLKSAILDEDGRTVWSRLGKGSAYFGRLRVEVENKSVLVDGNISPVKNHLGQASGYVLMGTDVTEAEARLEEARIANQKMSDAQNVVVGELRNAMKSLSKGDLKVRIETPFDGDYDMLRIDFNSAVGNLDTAIHEILMSADTIRNEASSVSGAADAFSRRTEQQAATLEETAAAISQLTASVASAAQGAKQANDIVTKAREDADSSGTIVQETVDAMGAIESSAQKISRIIGVIDEIAFQTNLLALNAGVEAARAGDAGRGFAVVASEVRALAQRSSDAAQEISQLISTSGEHVKRGVSLVDKAGEALTGIAETIGDVADHVSEIAASAREQATGVDEINTAMNQLDQVTQKNVAMFEETMAATQSLTAEANGLVTVTRRFDCSNTAHATGTELTKETSSTPVSQQAAEEPQDSAQKATSHVSGNLAVAISEEADEDWTEF